MPQPTLVYSTKFGKAYRGDSRLLVKKGSLKPHSVDLIFTSPPFALTRPKDYGNKSQTEYVQWFESFVPMLQEMLSATGSLVVDIGGSYLPGGPRRSTYHFELAVALSKHFDLCQEFYWYNPAKLPTPAQWVNIDRVRVKDSVNLVLWFARDAARTKANNRRVLKRYSASMRTLLRNGYQVRKRPSNHDISASFLTDNKGAIPANLLGFAHGDVPPHGLEGQPYEAAFDNILSVANTASNDRYLQACKKHGLKPHPARFPVGLPAFFIEFLTEKGDLVCDPFAGSNTTGDAAETLGRKWIACDLDSEGEFAGTYVRASAFRFLHANVSSRFSALPSTNWTPVARQVAPGRGKHGKRP